MFWKNIQLRLYVQYLLRKQRKQILQLMVNNDIV